MKRFIFLFIAFSFNDLAQDKITGIPVLVDMRCYLLEDEYFTNEKSQGTLIRFNVSRTKAIRYHISNPITMGGEI